jgi:hypothetical protein
MANLSNINNKFLVTTGGNVLIGQTSAVGSSILQVTGTMTADTVDGTVITDGFITMGFAQINRYGAAIELQYTPTNAATLVKIGANGSNPTIFNAYTGDATFAGDVTANGYLTLTGQATPQLFMQSNTSGTPNWTLIAGTNGYFTIGRAGVANDFYFDPSGNATFTGNVKLTDEKILGLRTSTNDYALQYRDLDFRLIGSADGTTQRKFSFGYYTSDNPAGTWNGKTYINSYTGNVGIGVDPSSPLTIKSNSTSTASSGLIIQANSSTNSIVRLGERSNGRARLEMLDSGVTKIAFYTDGNNNYINAGNVGIGTTLPKAKLDVNGGFCVDSKAHTLTNAFTTCLTVNLNSHTGCYVTLTCFGDWGSHSSAAYRGEFFLQNGANAYAEPGIILRQDDNTSNGTDQIVCQIVDPAGSGNPKDFEIQIRTTATTGTTSFTGQLTYTVQGQFNSIT